VICGGSHHFVFGFWDLRMKVLYDLFLKKNAYVIVGALGIEEQVGTSRFRRKVFIITIIVFNFYPTSKWE
jgi:hypothetical protein